MSLYELFVRRPLFLALEHHLRRTIPDNETRFRIAGNLMLYSEKSPRQSEAEHAQFRSEIEGTLGKADSDRLFSMARTLRNSYGITLMAARVVRVVLFILGTWALGRVFVGWGWTAWTSLLAAAFVVGAILELVKWLIVWRLARNFVI